MTENVNNSNSGAWVSLAFARTAVANELVKLRLDADEKTKNRIDAAYESWRHSGFLYWLTRRPRPVATPLGRATFVTPAQVWFESLPFSSLCLWRSYDNPTQGSLTVHPGRRAERLEKLLDGMAKIPRSEQKVFLTLDDLSLLGDSPRD